MPNIAIGQKVRIIGGQYKGKTGTFNGMPVTFVGSMSDNSPCIVKLDDGLEVDTFFFNLEIIHEEGDKGIHIGSKVCVVNGVFKGYLGKVRMATSDNNLFYLVDLLNDISVEINFLDMIPIVGSTIFTK